MKKNYKNKILGMSVAAAMLLGSSAYAGKIIGADANAAYIDTTPPTQFGFGGWNFNNINVVMSNGGDFNTTTGVYTSMTYGDTFYSEIKSTVDNTTLLATLHGKDWPVGEPAGVKVINGDAGQGGKPENCIMTTSYLSAEDNNGVNGYLDADTTPAPVTCSSPFQTHKRFKIKMLPTMVDNDDNVSGYWGRSFDLKFNLQDGDTSTELYQVLQKINNYTGKRLDGYKIEILDENNQTNPNLTLSIDVSTWGETDLANFAHGLWGPIDDHFDEPGFFDSVRAYYPAKLSSDKYSLSYVGPIMGANYKDMFGNWLTNAWAPAGIFYDFDDNPSTDADLIAFWGVSPLEPEGSAPEWHKGQADNWEKVTLEELLAMKNDKLYFIDWIDDTLNLGLNYIVNVGNNSLIGNTFTIRITPHVAPESEQVPPPSYVLNFPDYLSVSNVGTIKISPAPNFAPGDTLKVEVLDTDLDINSSSIDQVTITVDNNNSDVENVVLYETTVDSKLFVGYLPTSTVITATSDDGTLTVVEGTIATATYIDESEGNALVTDFTTAVTPTSPSTVPPAVLDPSSGGGGCTYNPESKHFDIMFLMMMALGLLYPFRRRFIK